MAHRRWSTPWITVTGSIYRAADSTPMPNAFVCVLAPHSNDTIPIADCSCDPRFRSEAECEAIAALIAAAPEMYMAIEAILAGNGAGFEMARAALANADLVKHHQHIPGDSRHGIDEGDDTLPAIP